MILKSVDVIHAQNKSLLASLRIPYNQPFAITPIHRDPSVVFEYNWSVLVLSANCFFYTGLTQKCVVWLLCQVIMSWRQAAMFRFRLSSGLRSAFLFLCSLLDWKWATDDCLQGIGWSALSGNTQTLIVPVILQNAILDFRLPVDCRTFRWLCKLHCVVCVKLNAPWQICIKCYVELDYFRRKVPVTLPEVSQPCLRNGFVHMFMPRRMITLPSRFWQLRPKPLKLVRFEISMHWDFRYENLTATLIEKTHATINL